MTISVGHTMSSTSGAVAAGRWADEDMQARLLAENDQLAARVQRLAPVLARMVRDLAAARRENTTLRRENQQLRVRLAMASHRPAGASRVAAVVAMRGSVGQRSR
ncbi:MAG TPA: hypothetical protein VNC12_10465 [Solirubrobacteraceae bacterium]|nr:hypothetical protein [Solirubrobacteraceae bacterium]